MYSTKVTATKKERKKQSKRTKCYSTVLALPN